MIKTIFAGIWVAALLSGSVMFFSSSSDDMSADDKAAPGYFGGLDYVKLDPMSISLVRNDAVRGYLLLNAAYTFDPEALVDLAIPLEYILKDIILTSVQQNKELDVLKLSSFDSKEFQEQLLKDANGRFGKKTIHEVLILKLEFITIENVRDMLSRRS